jgi:hypothetical protein
VEVRAEEIHGRERQGTTAKEGCAKGFGVWRRWRNLAVVNGARPFSFENVGKMRVGLEMASQRRSDSAASEYPVGDRRRRE